MGCSHSGEHRDHAMVYPEQIGFAEKHLFSENDS